MRSRRAGFRFPVLALAAVVLAASTASCDRPRFVGPQLQEPPQGFLYDANATSARKMFMGRDIQWQGGWWRMETVNDDHASIFITAHPGPTSRQDVQEAHDAHVERWSNPPFNEYGGVEQLRIDDRPAWGWRETQYRKGSSEVAAQQFRAVVSYDTVSYAISYFSNIPEHMDVEAQKATISTFAVGKVEWDFGLTALSVVAALVLLSFLKPKRKDLASGVRLARIEPEGPEVKEPPEPEGG